MIIVNQNRDEIINFEKMNNIYVCKSGEVKACANMEDCVYVLGKYESEERAKEVLKGIYSSYSLEQIFKRVDRDFQDQIAKKYEDAGIIPFAFQMPEK